jgi:uncharacterized repeat protein (TIGR01451 family)
MNIKHLATLALAVGISATSAAETAYDLTILNNATLNYSVSNIGQTEVKAEKSFKVDRKVVFILDAPTAIGTAATLSTQQNVAYTLQNNSNAPIRFALTLADASSGETAHTPAVTDNTVSNPGYTIHEEVSGDLVFDANTDSAVTYVELAAAGDVAGGDLTTIYIVSTPTLGVNADIFVHTLTATAQEPTGTLIAGATVGATISHNNADGWDEGVTQTVFDSTLLGTRINTAAIQISAAALSMDKTVTVISDPINDTTNPKAIPGAVVEYTLTVTNTGPVIAPAVSVVDTVPAVFDLTLPASVYTIDTVTIPSAPTVTLTDVGVDTSTNVVTFPNTDIPAESGGTNGVTTFTLRATLK